MRKFQKIAAVALSSAMAVSGLAACSSKDNGTTTAAPSQGETKPAETKPAETKAEETAAPTTEAPKRDLGGMSIIIGDWWSGDPAEPEGKYEEALAEYREEIQERNNFTIAQKKIAEWGTGDNGQQTICSQSIQAGDPAAQVMVLDSAWVPGLLNNNMFYPVNTLPSFNFEDSKWNKGVVDAMTFNGNTYGFAVGHEPRLGVFFNKRLIAEAGYGEEDIYDWQKNGEWTWSKFEELCAKCTQDTDNDGKLDTYALCSFNSDFFPACILSGGAEIVGKDENGHYTNGTTTDAFLTAMNWGADIWNKYNRPEELEEGASSQWDYFKQYFKEGKAAMRVAEEYNKGELADMEDDWGFVLFPAKDGLDLVSYDRENVLFIPSCYDAETADKIAYAYNLYTNEVPGYEGGDNWKRSYYSAYRDTRAVDETLDRMRNGKTGARVEAYVANLDLGDGFFWSIGGGTVTPAEAIEAKKAVYDQVIAEANEAIDKLGK